MCLFVFLLTTALLFFFLLLIVYILVKFSSALVVVKGYVLKVGVKMYKFRLSAIAFAKYYILG